MEGPFLLQSSCGIMDEDREEDIGSFSTFEDDDDEEETGGDSSASSSSSDLMEGCLISNGSLQEDGSVFEMSDLFANLPLKRGLSKYFEGKSQSFSSLHNAKSLEDLAKPEQPYKKKMKASKSYGGGLDSHRILSFTKAIVKKPFRGSYFSHRRSFNGGGRPGKQSASFVCLF